VLDEGIVDALFLAVTSTRDYVLTIDLAAQTIDTPDGKKFHFEIDPFRKHCLLNGLDDIGLTLQHADEIRAYEDRRRERAPWLFDAAP
jgi:3-isopropylmalate/(R)-2-methylmalate dehydratase small subunit